VRQAVVSGFPVTSGGKILSVFFVLACGVGWGLSGLARAQQEPVPTVKDIAVEGNRRVQAAAILARVKTRIGDPFSPAALREDARSIFALGFFDDVQVRTEEFEGGVRVVFAVAERPILREVGFEGNRELKTEDLRAAAALRVGVLYNPVDVRKAEEAIRQKYDDEGFFGATITPRTELTPEGDLRVVFRIDEGRKLYIDRIVIEGNHALSAKEIKGAMETKERYLWILPFSTVHRRVFDDDVDRILNLYADHGYIQARVESHDIVPDLRRGKVTLYVRLVEGAQFHVGTLSVRGNEILSAGEILRIIRLKPGDVFDRGLLRDGVRAVTDRYSEIGRARAEVDPQTEVDSEKSRVNVVLAIAEGNEVYVERINITGNQRSSEKVLRRELRVSEGELFTNQKLVRSRQRLFNLGYFEEVNASVEPGSAPDKVVVNINVKERATGLFSIGAGYSSLDGLFGTVDLTQRNLFGRGWEAFARFRIGTKARLGLVGFTEPYLFDMPLRAGFDVYDTQRDFDDFNEERLGGDLRASYPLGEFTTISGVYRLENVTVSNISNTASDDLKEQIGTKLNSVVNFVLTRDSRDNVFEPTLGSRHSIDLAFAGLGGDVQYYRVVGETAWWFPLPIFNWVLATRGLAGVTEGWGGQTTPIFERFFLGGSTTLRGQRTRSVAPKDFQGNVIGGDTELVFNLELLFPIVPHFRLALFFDTGNAYGFGVPFNPTNLRYGAGPGVRFFSPMGPIRLDYGFNLDRQPGEKVGYVNFSVGAPF
jgi:outer membrane protein insertion porin family